MRRLPTGANRVPRAFDPASVRVFRFQGFEWDGTEGVLRCRYALDDLQLEERVAFDTAADPGDPKVHRAFRLVHLLAGVSYFKAACPPVIDVGCGGLTTAERSLLEAFYLDGLGEFAHRNGIDLRSVRIDAEEMLSAPIAASPASEGFALVPFGGGVDSIVSVEAVRASRRHARLFVVNDYPAIESSIATTGLDVVRASRRIDPQLLRLNERGAYNGHVPVTGILSAIAVASAVLHGATEVVMSNEWSASRGNLVWQGREVNHQWSKSLEFEDLFRAAVHESLAGTVDYFSLLRPFTSLRIAEAFSRHRQYFSTFRSCNRAFHIDERARRGEWCGVCDKCCFVDLVLAPFVERADLEAIFGGREPLQQPELRPRFDALLGLSSNAKPWECVGDEAECRASALLAARREDRAADAMVHELAQAALLAQPSLAGEIPAMMQPIGRHNIPARHAAALGLG